jgi:hypothetical protein
MVLIKKTLKYFKIYHIVYVLIKFALHEESELARYNYHAATVGKTYYLKDGLLIGIW